MSVTQLVEGGAGGFDEGGVAAAAGESSLEGEGIRRPGESERSRGHARGSERKDGSWGSCADILLAKNNKIGSARLSSNAQRASVL